MKTYWIVIEKDNKQVEIELNGYTYGGEFRCKEVIVTDWTEDDNKELHDWAVDNLINKDYLFEIFDEKVRGEGYGNVLDVSLL